MSTVQKKRTILSVSVTVIIYRSKLTSKGSKYVGIKILEA